MQTRLDSELTVLKGIGENKANSFLKLNICTINDLLRYYPRDYQEYQPVKSVADLCAGEVAAVRITMMDNFFQKTIKGKVMVTISATDETGKVDLVFFHLTYLRKVLKPGSQFVIHGMVREKGKYYEFIQPQLLKPSEYEENRMRLQPVYPTVKGTSSKTISKTMKQAFAQCDEIPENLSNEIRAKYELEMISDALKQIHFPNDFDSLLEARKRLVFEEFYTFFLSLNELRKDNLSKPSNYFMIETADCKRFIESLPYRLTNAQIRVWEEISQDLQSGYVMNRLVQGDVGSGKTVLAILSMLMCVSNGEQCVFMAPTEVLATQHYQTVKKMTEKYKLPFVPVLLTGKMAEKDRRVAKELIKTGKANAVIGTHALFQESITYQKLALVITDEQHRFGVRQRESLEEKSESPHVLVMSATPIPRTLATVLYGDLQVSVVDEVPAKRLPIKNCVVDTKYRPKAYEFMKEQIKLGKQIYIVCSQVAQNEDEVGDLSLENVTDYTLKLRELFEDEYRIEMLHGQMKSMEKNRIMGDFEAGRIDILVSTTVIEVGIDVPNATVMMIENADRFGLAQLHQLRGRVGRGDCQSYCIFMTTNKNEHAMERLQILLKSNDGFVIANEDLRLRGPGDLLGIRQSGQMNFRLGDIYQDSDLLLKAAEAANNT